MFKSYRIKDSAILLSIFSVSLLMTACSKTSSNMTQSLEPSKIGEISNTEKASKGGSTDHSMSMDLGPADNEYDLRYIDSMVLHHQGAINMAQEVLKKSQRPEMKKLAQDIITAQKKEIAQMKEWRNLWYKNASKTPLGWHAGMNHSMPMDQKHQQSMMMNMDLGKADDKFDMRFIEAMIPHHEGALVMARDALNKSKRPEIQQLSRDILASQEKEIEQMKQWQKKW